MKPTAALLVALAMMTTQAQASSPSIRGIKPVGGQRGTEVEVRLSGQRLSDARELLFYQPGITVKSLDVDKRGQVTATLAIAADAALGQHDFRLVTDTGVTPLRTFSVGALPDVEEKEPNNDFAAPQPIDMNVTVNGVADNEDADYYAITAKKGERITAEVEGIRLGLTLFDPYVAILDGKRFEMASSDDSALIWQDAFVSIVAPEDGTYLVVVRETSYRGNANCLYRLHVGNFPRPTATIPSGGPLGQEVTVRWIGDVLGETVSKIVLPEIYDRDFGIVAKDETGTAPYPNAFRLSPFGNTIEAEPNDGHANATVFKAPQALNGVIEKEGDVDCYAFEAKKDQSFDVQVYARQIRSPLDSVLSIWDKGGKRIANNDDTGGPDSRLRFKAPKDGTYVVRVTDHLQNGGPDYAYRIEMSPVEPRLEVTTPNEALRRGSGTIAVAVPRGNRATLLINASRKDFGGAVALEALNLPEGVTIEADTMEPNMGVVPVVFTASDEAPKASSLAKVAGKVVDSSADIPTEFTSTAELVQGQNNVPFWTRTVETLAVAVVDEVPFTIEVVEPKVPIVRGGVMNLKVVAHRKPGFYGPIAVNLPWNPPGIASKGQIVIPEREDEVFIPINASGNAELKTSRFVVNGTYIEQIVGPPKPGEGRRGRFGGRVTVSSPFAKLTVAPQYLTLKFAAASVEQGGETDLAVTVNQAVEFDGEATVTLVGLPNKVETEPVTITKDTKDIVFHLKTDEASPVGETKSLFCEVVVTKDGEPITHNLGTGRLRIDAPLPEKKTIAAAPAAGDPEKPAEAPAKPLSRLEKLRQESQERAKAAAEAGNPSN